MNEKFNYEVSHIVVNPHLIDFLKQKPKGRHTRLEAYFDLLSMAMVKKPFSVLPKTPSAELLGQFDTTVTELAQRWAWQRATVRDFLSALTTIGQLSREDSYKSMTITFESLKFKWFQDFVAESYRCSHQEKSASSIADKDECFENSHINTSAKRESPSLFDSAVSDLEKTQREVCRELYNEIFADISEIIRELAYTPHVEHALYRAYYNVCGADRQRWQEYMLQMKSDDSLSLTIYGNEVMSSAAGKVESFFIRFGREFRKSKKGEQK